MAEKLAGEAGHNRVVVLPQHCEDVLFSAHFSDADWVVYAQPLRARVAAGGERRPETSVRKMHSVTVRSWLHTGDAVRKHNHVLAELQQVGRMKPYMPAAEKYRRLPGLLRHREGQWDACDALLSAFCELVFVCFGKLHK